MMGLALTARTSGMQMENEGWRLGTCLPPPPPPPLLLGESSCANPAGNSSICRRPAFPRTREDTNPIQLGRASTFRNKRW